METLLAPDLDPEPQLRQRRQQHHTEHSAHSPAPGGGRESGPPPEREGEAPHPGRPSRRPRRYLPRKCRICLEEVQPTWESSSSTFGLVRASDKPKYISDDPDLGRLMSPCLCKGSQKYVHEGCLEAWRHARPAERNMWKCPTCNFEYRMARLNLSRILGHWATSLALTIVVVLIVTFLMGFVGDKVIRLYLDPFGGLFDEDRPTVHFDLDEREQDIIEKSWYFHFVKGFFSVGVIAWVKTMLMYSPFYYLNLGGRRRRGDGRNRYTDISTVVLMVGSVTFIYAVWKAIKAGTKQSLAHISKKIVDVQDDDDGDGDGDDHQDVGNAE